MYFARLADMDYREVPEEAKDSYFASLFAIACIHETGEGLEAANTPAAIQYFKKLTSIPKEEIKSGDSQAFYQISMEKVKELEALETQNDEDTLRKFPFAAILSLVGMQQF